MSGTTTCPDALLLDVSASPSQPDRRTPHALLALLVLTTALLAVLLPSAHAQDADVVEVRLTAEGPVPADVRLPDGGGVVRLMNTDGVPHEVRTAPGSPAASYPDMPIGPGATAEVTFEQSDTYAYEDERLDLLAAETFGGRVVVAAPAPPPAEGEPAPSASDPSSPTPPAPAPQPGAPAPPAPGAPAPGAPAPAPEVPPTGLPAPPPGGSGTTSLPGFGTGGSPAPLDGLLFPPSLTPLLAEEPGSGGSSPLLAVPPVSALPGPLPGNPTSRPLGLPAALAALAAAGVTSLLVRVLLAEPAARRRSSPIRGPVPVTVG